jgi:hypothetical protein
VFPKLLEVAVILKILQAFSLGAESVAVLQPHPWDLMDDKVRSGHATGRTNLQLYFDGAQLFTDFADFHKSCTIVLP